MNIHFVIHESFESPGAISKWAQSNKHTITSTKLYDNEVLPIGTTSIDFLVVMGGPQSPATTLEECPHFDAKAEIDLIADAVKNDKLVLGVCLGAQLIGEALGAKFDHSPNREIGVFDITLTENAKNDPTFSKFPRVFPVGHWHGDMPGLTSESEVLAFSEGCPRQIVKYSPKVYGFQCHFEFTKESIEGMINNCSHELDEYKNLPYIQNENTLRANDYSEINNKLFSFLDYMENTYTQNEN